MFTYVCICFCYNIPLKELRANICFRKGFRGVKGFSSLYQTAEAASAVYIRPRKGLWRSLSDHRSQTFLDIVLCRKLPFCVPV
jgi:hypothetical protein